MVIENQWKLGIPSKRRWNTIGLKLLQKGICVTNLKEIGQQLWRLERAYIIGIWRGWWKEDEDESLLTMNTENFSLRRKNEKEKETQKVVISIRFIAGQIQKKQIS